MTHCHRPHRAHGPERSRKSAPSCRVVARAALGLLGLVLGVGCASEEVISSSGASEVSFSQLTALASNEKEAVLSPDGSRLAFVSDQDGSSSVYLRTRDGRIVPLTSSSQDDGNPSWSPDGHRLAFHSDRGGYDGIWLMTAEGGEAEALTPRDMASFHAAWSPDGSRIAFISNAAGSFDVWTVPVDGGSPKPVTSHSDNEWWPRWSPDSQQIVFYTTWGDKMTDIWTIAADGSDLNQITANDAEDYRPAWSPDGEWITFVSNRHGQSDIWVVPAHGGEPRRVTDDQAYRDFPSWSPDGKALILSYQPNTSLYAIPVAGGAPVRLTNDAASETRPSVSPDGRQIAYQARHQREENVWVMPLNGGEPRVLAGANEFQADGVWSPDGSAMVFVQGLGGDPRSANLWTIPTAGGTPRQLTEVGYVSDPVWCEQGRSIVFAARESEDAWTQLWKIPAEGGVPVALTTLAQHNRPSDCSADGSLILFTQAATGAYGGSLLANGRLLVLPVSGGAPRPLPGDYPREGARWSPDGSMIAFISSEEGGVQLYVMPTAGGDAVRVTSGQEVQSWPSWSPDGQTLYVAMRNGGYDIWRIELRSLLGNDE